MPVAITWPDHYRQATVKFGIGNLREKLRRHRRPPAGSAENAGRGELVLVADSDGESLERTCLVLKGGGYEPLGVTDGAEALAVFSDCSDRIRAILTDAVLPTLSGIDLAKVIRRMRPGARIMAAGIALESKFDELREIGVTSFVPKPCKAGELLSGLRRLLDRS